MWKRFGVGVKTIRRDLQAFKELGHGATRRCVVGAWALFEAVSRGSPVEHTFFHLREGSKSSVVPPMTDTVQEFFFLQFPA